MMLSVRHSSRHWLARLPCTKGSVLASSSRRAATRRLLTTTTSTSTGSRPLGVLAQRDETRLVLATVAAATLLVFAQVSHQQESPPVPPDTTSSRTLASSSSFANTSFLPSTPITRLDATYRPVVLAGRPTVVDVKDIPSRDEQIRRLQQSKRQSESSDQQSSGWWGSSSRSRNKMGIDLHQDTLLDVLVIGGGCTGSGVALDCATRGLSCAVIDKHDFGHETSSRSTKLIWAGIRYIATAFSSLLRVRNVTRPWDALSDFVQEFQMVQHAHAERRILLENNPHLTYWVPIAIPITKWLYPTGIQWPWKTSSKEDGKEEQPPFGHALFSTAPLLFPLIFKFYDAMSHFTCPPSHIMGKARAMRKFPQLANEEEHHPGGITPPPKTTTVKKDRADGSVKYFQVFYEGAHNDARTNTYLALTAAEQGAIVVNHLEMIAMLTDSDGKAYGITCRDNLTNKVFDVHAKQIIFAGGPFTDQLRKMEQDAIDNKTRDAEENTSKTDFQPAVAAAAGTHIVLPGYYCPGGIGMLDVNTSDGRFLFFLPWQGSTIVGTTDRKDGKPATSDVEPPEEEIQWILREVEKYLSSDLKVRRADVQSAWQGYRPLAKDPHLPPGQPVSRDHIISTNPTTGVTFITGGKWTTYRRMAQDVIDRVLERNRTEYSEDDKDRYFANKAGPCKTETLPLRGGEGYSRNVPIMLVQEFGVSESTAKHLAHTYGMLAFEVCRLAEPTGQRWPRFGNLLVPGYPYLECEVEYACKKEMCCTVKDMLTLRMRLAFLNKEAALTAAPRVADLMAETLGWSKKEKKRQLQEAIDFIQTFGGPIPNQHSKTWVDNISTVSDVRDLFHTFDVSENGYIDVTEFQDVATKILGQSKEEAAKTFTKIDTKKKGKIYEEEFVAWWNDRRRHDKLKSKIAEHFLVPKK